MAPVTDRARRYRLKRLDGDAMAGADQARKLNYNRSCRPSVAITRDVMALGVQIINQVVSYSKGSRDC